MTTPASVRGLDAFSRQRGSWSPERPRTAATRLPPAGSSSPTSCSSTSGSPTSTASRWRTAWPGVATPGGRLRLQPRGGRLRRANRRQRGRWVHRERPAQRRAVEVDARISMSSPARAAVIAAAVAAGVSAFVAMRTGFARESVATAVVEMLTGWSFVAAGLVAAARRPGSRVGVLMIAVGFAWFAPDLRYFETLSHLHVGRALRGLSVARSHSLARDVPDRSHGDAVGEMDPRGDLPLRDPQRARHAARGPQA